MSTGVDEAAVVVRDLAEIERHVVAAPGIVLPAVVAGEVQAEPVEVLAVADRPRARRAAASTGRSGS